MNHDYLQGKEMKQPLRKTKIVLIQNIASPYIIPLFSQFAAAPGIELHVYFMALLEKNREWVTRLGSDFKYKVLRGFAFNFFKKDFFAIHVNPTIVQELMKSNPDVVISGGYSSLTAYFAFLYSKIYRKPFVVWSESTINEPSFLRTISLPLVKFIIRHSDALVACGTRSREYLLRLGARPAGISTAYCTVDTEFYKQRSGELKAQKQKLKGEFGIVNKSVILYVGQLIERKGLKYLIKAYSQLRPEFDVALLIVGGGMQKDELAELCRRDNVRDVFFTGYIQLETLTQYYVMSDIFVLPSLEETWGRVINEAMACGLPVISTIKAGAPADMIINGLNGFVVKDKNVEQLHQAMSTILSDPSLKQSMGVKSQQMIDERFTIEHAVRGFMSAVDYAMIRRKQ